MWGLRTDDVGEEDGDCRCQFPRIARDGAATNNISTATGHRNSGPDLRINHEVAIPGWAHYRRCRAHTRDQQLERNRVYVHQNVFPGVLWSTGSTMEAQGPTAESGGDGGPSVLLPDVGPSRRALPVAEYGTRLARPSTYRAALRARQIRQHMSYAPNLKEIGYQGLKTSCGNGDCWLRAPWLDNLTDDFRSNWHSGHSGRRVGSRARVPGGNPTNVPEGRF